MSYQERLRQYEREKSEFVDSGKPYTGKEYEAFIRHLVKKWRI